MVSINQSLSGYLIDAKHMSKTLLMNSSAVLEKQIAIWYEIKWRKLRSQIMITYYLYFQKKNHVFIEEEGNPSEKVVIVEEEIDGN